MLYELACGERPFHAESISKLMYKIAKEPHASAIKHNPELPVSVSILIDPLLSKKVDLRITTASIKAECAGMGTTVLVAAFYGDRITAAHVGDSRMYRLRSNILSHVTEDHSLIHEQVRRALKPSRHPVSNDLTNEKSPK